MSILDSISRSIKNVFVGSHRGEDFVIENLEQINKKKEMPKPENTNDLGVDPNEWFNTSEEPVGIAPPPGELKEDEWFSEEKPKEDKTVHQKMYEMATAKYNPFAVGGSERLGGGSEEAHK